MKKEETKFADVNAQDIKDMPAVPLYAYESMKSSFMKVIKLLIFIIVLLVAVIGYDTYQDSLYDYSDIYVDSEDGIANYLEAGMDGVINNGESGSKEED